MFIFSFCSSIQNTWHSCSSSALCFDTVCISWLTVAGPPHISGSLPAVESVQKFGFGKQLATEATESYRVCTAEDKVKDIFHNKDKHNQHLQYRPPEMYKRVKECSPWIRPPLGFNGQLVSLRGKRCWLNDESVSFWNKCSTLMRLR